MSISRKAEKRKARKDKKRQELEKKLNEEKVKFDIICLFKTEHLDTKPNMAKFLKDHVQLIRCFNNGKIQFYPSFNYQLSKVFVKFLDQHELIYDMITDGKFTPRFYMYYKLEEVKLSDKDEMLIEQFFQLLQKFKFIY